MLTAITDGLERIGVLVAEGFMFQTSVKQKLVRKRFLNCNANLVRNVRTILCDPALLARRSPVGFGTIQKKDCFLDQGGTPAWNIKSSAFLRSSRAAGSPKHAFPGMKERNEDSKASRTRIPNLASLLEKKLTDTPANWLTHGFKAEVAKGNSFVLTGRAFVHTGPKVTENYFALSV